MEFWPSLWPCQRVLVGDMLELLTKQVDQNKHEDWITMANPLHKDCDLIRYSCASNDFIF